MESILISNLNNLGDVVCGTAGLDLIRRHFPHARIGLMVKADAEGVMRGHPLIDDLHVYRYRSGGGLAALGRMAAEIRPKKYEIFLSLDRKPRGVLVALLAGIRRRVVPDTLHLGTRPRWWMPVLCHEVLRYPANSFRSLVEQFQDPVRRTLGIAGSGRTSLPPPTPERTARAAELLAPAGDGKKVGYSVRANAECKNWPAERFAALMDRLAGRGDVFQYITGAPGDAGYIDDLIALCRLAAPVNLAGKTDVMDVAALAAASDLFVTLDTGAVHIAGNSGIRNLICLFTATIPEGVLDSARQARVFWTGEPCCPCASCPHPFGTAPCRTGITVDMVYEAAAGMLAEG